MTSTTVTQEQIDALPAAIGRAVTLIEESRTRGEEDVWEEFRDVLDVNVYYNERLGEWRFAIYPVVDHETYTREALADGSVYNHNK